MSPELALAKARRNLDAAAYLLGGGFFAEAVTRAYYAAFHAARGALLAVGVQAKTHRGVHTQVSDRLVREGHLPADASHWLRVLAGARAVADYDDGAALNEAQAHEALDLAVQFVQAVTTLLGQEPA